MLINSYRYAVTFDADAQTYITAVETADGQALESGVKDAINAFVVGCKTDGIWTAIKACCILAGARTLSGALVPLVGAAPTNVNFVAGNYNRETGLVGNGSTKYLNSNRNNNADPQDSNHNAVYVSTAHTTGGTGSYIDSGNQGTGSNNLGRSGTATNLFVRNRSSASTAVALGSATGLLGTSRDSSLQYIIRAANANTTANTVSQEPSTTPVYLFARPSGDFPNYSNARLAFYSIGEFLDLALLDARVTTLINAFASAIP